MIESSNPYIVTFLNKQGGALGWHSMGVPDNTPEAIQALVGDQDPFVPDGTTHIVVSDRIAGERGCTRVLSMTLYRIDTREVVTTETTVTRGA